MTISKRDNKKKRDNIFHIKKANCDLSKIKVVLIGARCKSDVSP
jgi:hypothetical protein